MPAKSKKKVPPQRCHKCGKGGLIRKCRNRWAVCDGCRFKQYEIIAEPRCKRCGKLLKVGRRVCQECQEKRQSEYIASYAKNYLKNRDEVLRGAGLCNKCGKNPADHPYPACQVCRGRSSDRAKSRIAALEAAGLCHKCGKNPSVPGYCACAECAAASRSRRV